jgi:2-polyprenyl-6-methoxyphenol hydroxylase-like FAD-dependent oxidoreductase
MLYDAIKDAQPLSPIYGFRHTQNRLRHYEQLSRWPEGLVVLGDAVCTFNPVYGQGMTTAALGALALKACLGEQRQHRPNGELTGMPRRFQKTLAEINTLPWLMATGEDFRFPQTEGDKPSPVVRALHRYLDGVKILAVDDQETYLKFLQVMHLLEPLRTLFQPLLALRVLRQTVGRGTKQLHPFRMAQKGR